MDGVLVRQIRIMFVFLDSSRDVLILEAAARFELAHKGFADLCLTAWLRRRIGMVGP